MVKKTYSKLHVVRSLTSSQVTLSLVSPSQSSPHVQSVSPSLLIVLLSSHIHLHHRCNLSFSLPPLTVSSSLPPTIQPLNYFTTAIIQPIKLFSPLPSYTTSSPSLDTSSPLLPPVTKIYRKMNIFVFISIFFYKYIKQNCELTMLFFHL